MLTVLAQGVPVSYSSGGVSIGSSTVSGGSTTSSPSGTSQTTSSTTGTAGGGALLSAAVGSSSGFSGSSFTATQSSDISAYLATAIPASARTESSDACFVNTPYSYYSTPTWYSTLPTQAQSYYSSVNQGNTAACTLSPAGAAALAGAHSTHHGLSGGAIAGIVIGAIVAALLLLLLLLCCLRRRRHSRRDTTGAGARAMRHDTRDMPRGSYGNEKGMVGGTGSHSNGRAPYGNEKGLVGAGVPGHMSQSHYGNGNGMVGGAPITNGRAAQAPYENRGPNEVAAGQAPYDNRGSTGYAAAPTGQAGSQMPYGAGGGYGGSGAGGPTPDYSHTTTTTTRIISRPR